MIHMIKKYFKFNIKALWLSWHIKSLISKKRLKNELKKFLILIKITYPKNIQKQL